MEGPFDQESAKFEKQIIMDNLFLSFYVLEGLQKKSIVHKKHVGTAIYKLVSCFTVFFFYLVNLSLYLFYSLFSFKMSFSLWPYRWYLIIGFLVIVLGISMYLKKYYLTKYPNPINLKSFDKATIRKFRINVVTISLLVILPILIFAVYLLFI